MVNNGSQNFVKKPLVSIVMNCYNGERYIKDAIESVLCQNYSNWEIVFWDNRSTDTSASIFKGYKDPRLKYFLAPEHTTLGEARNLAIAEACGTWVGFLDCDDAWFSDKLDRQVAIIDQESDDLGIVYGGIRIVAMATEGVSLWASQMTKYQKKENKRRLPEGFVFDRLIYQNFIPLVSALVRRSAFFETGAIDCRYRQAEDYDLFLKISQKYRVRAVQDEVALYRIHDHNATQSQLQIGFDETMSIVKRYFPMRVAKRAMGFHCVYELVRKLREKRFRSSLDFVNEYGAWFLIRSSFQLARSRLQQKVGWWINSGRG